MPQYLVTSELANSHPDNRGLKALWIDPPGSSGVAMVDRFRGQFNLSPRNAPTRSLSPFGGGAFRFDSASSRYFRTTIPVVTSLPVAVCCWAYPFSNHNGSIFDCRSLSVDFTGFNLSSRSTGQIRWYQNGGAGRTIATAVSTFPLNRWTRVSAFALSATEYRIYLNGVRLVTGSSDSGTTFNTTGTNVGRFEAGASSGEPFNGFISDLRVWSGTELTQDPDAFILRDYLYSQRLLSDPRLNTFFRGGYSEVVGGSAIPVFINHYRQQGICG